MNVLFVCKYNRFRSKAAEAFFNSIAEGLGHQARSAGIIKGSDISGAIISNMEKEGIMPLGPPRTLDIPLLRWQNMVVIVADDVPESIFCESRKQGKKVVVWSVSDCPEDDSEKAGVVLSDIRNKVKVLVASLSKSS
ncbi:hypothetical protein JW898_02930 [Candidatus Woesearchaeota archaeon]|nr:hypothetical protein [Candidatus Woesearchaeota archaeon]